MATTELLAVGTAAADSADITVTTAAPVTLTLKGSASGPIDSAARATITSKAASGSVYTYQAELNAFNPSQVISGAGTYRVSRAAGASFGVDQSS